ncbi:MAG: hypothetical protein HZB71_11400 [Betaproteobacteria bacterium]|nr:hypothetical protein [Betaproteobacteria bacterium]
MDIQNLNAQLLVAILISLLLVVVGIVYLARKNKINISLEVGPFKLGAINSEQNTKPLPAPLNCAKSDSNCLMQHDTPARMEIVSNFSPVLYLPLDTHFLNIANIPACNINVFPYIYTDGSTLPNTEFVSGFGYRFNGNNMISVHLNGNLPHDREARSFAFAIYPTQSATIGKPMFFFSYGQRICHDCDDGISNHDKSFGIFWGEPKPRDPIPDKYKGMGVRVFFYCEHCVADRTSENCDTVVILPKLQLNQWQFIVVSYDGDLLKFYMNGSEIFQQNVILNTSATPYLNIGGFVHHNERGAIIAKDLDYSMNGYIREFMMFRRVLTPQSVENLNSSVKVILKSMGQS